MPGEGMDAAPSPGMTGNGKSHAPLLLMDD
jgi:hypothetical protein